MIYIGFDPGLNGCGIAAGRDSLMLAGYVPSDVEGTPGQRGIAAGEYAAATLWWNVPDLGSADVTVVVELMQVYRSSRQVNPKWLIALAACAGAFAGTMRTRSAHRGRVCRVLTPQPREWKGTLDGDLMIEHIKRTLTAEEHKVCVMPSAVKTLGHNVYDAAGLYLWAAGRLGKKRVIHR